jgi:hypothetical protein
MSKNTCLEDLAVDLQGGIKGNYNGTDSYLGFETPFSGLSSSAMTSLFH